MEILGGIAAIIVVMLLFRIYWTVRRVDRQMRQRRRGR